MFHKKDLIFEVSVCKNKNIFVKDANIGRKIITFAAK